MAKLIPTVKTLILLKIIEEFKGKYFATCQKCGGSWQLRFNRIAVECYLCKCLKWWEKPGKRGRKKNDEIN